MRGQPQPLACAKSTGAGSLSRAVTNGFEPLKRACLVTNMQGSRREDSRNVCSPYSFLGVEAFSFLGGPAVNEAMRRM